MAIVVESDIIDHLRLMVRERKEALSAAEQALTAAIIDACPVKEGDEVYARVYRGGYVWLPVPVPWPLPTVEPPAQRREPSTSRAPSGW